MQNLLDRVRGWWQPGRLASQPVPFQVECSCGQFVLGQRQRHHQVIVCPTCKKNVFVLPVSALPPPRGASWSGRHRFGPALATTAGQPAAPLGGWPFWRWPLLAASLTLIAAAVGLLALLHFATPPPTSTGPVLKADPRQLILEGEQALAEGQFQTASQRLNLGLATLHAYQPPPSIQEIRRIRLLARQAELLGDLLTESLADIVHLAMVDAKQFPEQFNRRYKGRGVVFDGEVRRDGAGQYRFNYHLEAGKQVVRIELGDLQMLERLPLQKSTRLLFGARVANVGLEAGGFWAVRFEPDSGVLLTDERAVAASCPPPIDEELLQLLERQSAWASELP